MCVFEMIDFADMLGRMGELEADALAMPGLRHNLAQLEFPRDWVASKRNLFTIWGTALNHAAFRPQSMCASKG
jgi:hypothetical protein